MLLQIPTLLCACVKIIRYFWHAGANFDLPRSAISDRMIVTVKKERVVCCKPFRESWRV